MDSTTQGLSRVLIELGLIFISLATSFVAISGTSRDCAWIALVLRDGSSRRPLGLVVIGGLIVSQFMTFFVTPPQCKLI